MIPHKRIPGIRLSDYLACEKVFTGQWICNPQKGEIHAAGTGKPVSFRPNKNGYPCCKLRYKGSTINIMKHRAVYVIANIRFGLPDDLSLEVDHINHDKTDCRLENLRLITKHENEWAKPNAVKREVVMKIRERYDAGNITQKTLATEYGISRTAVSRIVRNETYVGIEGAV